MCSLLSPRAGAGVLLAFLCIALPLAAQDGEEEYPLLAIPSGNDTTVSDTGDFDLQAMRRLITGEAKTTLASINLFDTDVSLFVSGFWDAKLQGNYGFSYNRDLNQFAAKSEDSPILFTQEADLTLSLWVRDRWFVEANFLDQGETPAVNTYRAGYQGKEGEAVQYVGFGNTGLDFPAFPYLDLGGDNPASFGLYGKFGGGPLSFHSLVRYDMGAREERTFVGNRERNYAWLDPADRLRNRSFVLPDRDLDAAPEVYLEDEDGDLRDGSGRRWKKAQPTDYAAGAAAGLVELRNTPPGMVAAAYRKGGNSQPWNTSLGNYATNGAGGAGYLGEVSAWFGAGVNLADYPQCGGGAVGPGNKPGTVTLSNGVTALVLREGGAFSPFENASRYEAPSSSSQDAALVKLSSGDRISGYQVLPLDDPLAASGLPLYVESDLRRGQYELIAEGTARDRRRPEAMWPLADRYAGYYLPGQWKDSADMAIRFTNYGSGGGYVIGTDVVSGSVKVYRGGLEDPNASYSESSGTVTLGSPAGFNEVIRITYLKKSTGTEMGSLAAGVGAVYASDGNPFSANVGLGIRWNIGDVLLAKQGYTEEGATNPGTAGLGTKVAWEGENLKAQATFGLGFEQSDTVGMYHAAGMEDTVVQLPLPAADSFNSEPPGPISGGVYGDLSTSNQSDLIYRNYLEGTALGAKLQEINWGGVGGPVSGKTGPFPVRDEALTKDDVLGAEFALGGGKTWSAFEVPLGDSGLSLEQAKAIEVPFRFVRFSGTGIESNFKLILQIGTLSAKDRPFTENQSLIMEKQIWPPPAGETGRNPAAFGNEARISVVQLNEEDRRRLEGANYLRLVMVNTAAAALDGTVILAPPVVHGAPFRPVIVSGGVIRGANDSAGQKSVSAREWADDSLAAKYGDVIKRLHPSGGQRVLEVGWENLVAGDSPGADGRIGEVPLAGYRRLSFFFKAPETIPPDTRLRFLIARGPGSLGNARETALAADIPLDAFARGQWNRVDIRYAGENQGVFVNDSNISGAHWEYRPSARVQGANGASAAELVTGKSTYAAVFVENTAAPIPDGGFSFDEIILEEPAPAFRINGGTVLDWKRPGPLVELGGVEIAADPAFKTALESGFRGDPFTAESAASGGVISRSSAELTVLGVKLTGNYGLNWQDSDMKAADTEDFVWDAGHSVSRSFGPFSAAEDFSVSPSERELDHSFSLGLSAPVNAAAAANVMLDNDTLTRGWTSSLSWSPPIAYIPAPQASFSADWQKKGETAADWLKSYGEAWTGSWVSMVPDLGAGAQARRTRSLFSLTENTKPVGAAVFAEGTTNFSSPSNNLATTSMAALEVPVEFSGLRFLHRGERSYDRRLSFAEERNAAAPADALGDAAKFQDNLSAFTPLWKLFPLYSLFAPEAPAVMAEGIGGADGLEYSAFRDKVSVTGQFPNRYDFWAFVAPSSGTLRLERLVERQLDTDRDTLNWGGSLGWSAVNMFGAFGYYPVFPFYAGDEFSQALELSAAQPKNADNSWRLQSGTNAVFHGFEGGELSAANTLTTSWAAGTGSWLESVELAWTTPTERSLLSMFYDAVAGAVRTQSSWLTLSDLMDAGYEQLRKEKASFVIQQSGKEGYLSWSLLVGHESIVRIVGRLNFSVFAELEIGEEQASKTTSFLATIGTALRVLF